MRDRDDGFDAFALAVSPRPLRTAGLVVGREAAEDLVQDVLARMYVAWPRVREPESYAARALTNAVRARWRAGARQPELLVADPGSATDAEAPDTARRHAERDRLAAALGLLPARQRLAVVLRHVEDLPEAEVARQMGCSLGTVKSSTSRGLARLRDLLDRPAAGGLSADAPVPPISTRRLP